VTPVRKFLRRVATADAIWFADDVVEVDIACVFCFSDSGSLVALRCWNWDTGEKNNPKQGFLSVFLAVSLRFLGDLCASTKYKRLDHHSIPSYQKSSL